MTLYTSLVRIKLALNGGVIPPMTPVTDAKALAIVDPDFTIGLGAMNEVEGKGLQCPVRGCGKFFPRLRKHLNSAHSDIGGADAVTAALDIPRNESLASHESAAKQARPHDRAPMTTRSSHAVRKGHVTRKNARSTMSARNWRNRCEAQLKHALLNVQTALGRSPSLREFQTVCPNGVAVAQEIRKTYGSWNSFKAQMGVEVYLTGTGRFRRRRGRAEGDRDAVLAGLSAWYEQHGSLPSVNSVKSATRLPAIPGHISILRGMGTDSWPEAMRTAASLLDIHGGRYGLPVRNSEAAD